MQNSASETVGEAKARLRRAIERQAMKGTCAKCEHYASLEHECREGAPAGAMVPDENGQAVMVGFWPKVAPHRWCGKFKLDVNATTSTRVPENAIPA